MAITWAHKFTVYNRLTTIIQEMVITTAETINTANTIQMIQVVTIRAAEITNIASITQMIQAVMAAVEITEASAFTILTTHLASIITTAGNF